jgi:hypothetical protein
VKRLILATIIIAALAAGGVIWFKKHPASAATASPAEAAAPQKPAEEESEGAQISRDPNGNVVIHMNDEMQGDLGILVKKAELAQLKPELKGYGRVLDPATIAAQLTDLTTSQAAYLVSSNELARLKTLEGQGNASIRGLQAAEATAARDRITLQAARDHLAIAWGKAVADQKDLPAFSEALTRLDSALVRVDLPASEGLPPTPISARLQGMSGQSAAAEFLGLAPAMDSQIPGRGFFFLVKQNNSGIAVGEAVTAYLQVPGEAQDGVIIPRDAVIRTEGAGWVYVLNAAGDAFTRTQVALDRPTDSGWFVTKGVAPGNYFVTTAAQQLLSIELKGQLGE